jgi:broad specificity phosphatase PhoE
MREVEHRRHARRDPGGIHLNAEGLATARRVAPTLGRFDRVLSSPVPRALETVEALGLSVDAVLPELALVPDDVQRVLETFPPRSYSDYVQLARRRRVVAEYARQQAEIMRRELMGLPEAGRLLIVSHGGVIELGAAAARGHDVLGYGETAGYLEGVRLLLDRGEWVQAEVLRVTP